jgi:hypothetical protein|nr:hypothetical protein [uncultured Allomuricauda sp.]
MTENQHREEAKKCLEYLVSFIKGYDGDKKYVTYGQMAEAIGYPRPYTGSNFGRLIGKTLMFMGHLLDNINILDWQGRIPYIQAMVVAKNSGLPSDGLKEFIPDYPNLSNEKKKDLLHLEYQQIFKFGERWDYVLEQLGTHEPSPLQNNQGGRQYNPYGSEGSLEHRNLVKFISDHPEKVGFPDPVTNIKEFPLKSGDFVDVLLSNNDRVLGVEVKSRRSGEDDHRRGIFQCIKYREVLKAEDKINKLQRTVDCILVHEEEIVRTLERIRDTLGVNSMQISLKSKP